MTTRLRSILTSQRSRPIWEYARLQIPPIHCKRTSMLPFGVSFTTDVEIGIPELPADKSMSEPAYAHLVFEDTCTVSQVFLRQREVTWTLKTSYTTPSIGLSLPRLAESKQGIHTQSSRGELARPARMQSESAGWGIVLCHNQACRIRKQQ